MDQTEPIGPTTEDPEILPLLDFAPVVRKNKRHDGWSPGHQRGHIIGLALTGNVDRAAQSVGRTQSGAWTVRNSAGAEGFAAAWDAALALYDRRRCAARAPLPPAPPPPPRALPPPRRRGRRGPAPPPGRDPPDAGDWEEAMKGLFHKYLLKLKDERRCRLEGRIVEADFYVRQLTWLEVALDLGGRGHEVLELLKSGKMASVQVVATPISVLLETLRRGVWLEKGEADRPPPPPLGEHDDERSTGVPTSYNSARDGPYEAWLKRREAERRAAAEAQAAWEEKAKADAAAWRVRVGWTGEDEERVGDGEPAEDDEP